MPLGSFHLAVKLCAAVVMAHGGSELGLAVLVFCCPCVLVGQVWKLIYALLLGLVAGLVNLVVAMVMLPVHTARTCGIIARSMTVPCVCKPPALLVAPLLYLFAPFAWFSYGIIRGIYSAYDAMLGINLNEFGCSSDARENPLRNVFTAGNRHPPLQLCEAQGEFVIELGECLFDSKRVVQRERAADQEYFAQRMTPTTDHNVVRPQAAPRSPDAIDSTSHGDRAQPGASDAPLPPRVQEAAMRASPSNQGLSHGTTMVHEDSDPRQASSGVHE